ncbi:MAG: 7-carboxy-7-deazaguanine synthase [Alphaproteobacteria bacterium]
MTYAVREIFRSVQGEGANVGRVAVFCRFAGCNLWSGRESDRADAACRFCDTDFVGTDGPGGGRFVTAVDLAAAIAAVWGPETHHRFVVVTGGEPLLQLDAPLIAALHGLGFAVAVETNGTLAAPPGLDWVCVSPKAGTSLSIHSGDELKLVFPQEGLDPADYEALDFKHFFLQPMDGEDLKRATSQAITYCLLHPRWRLGVQVHKSLGLP